MDAEHCKIKKNENKIIWRILGCILFVFLLMALLIFFHINSRKNKAKDIAVTYLESVYEEQMDLVKVRLSLIDPAMYHVYFTPQNNPDLSFSVLVMPDFTLTEEPDDYLLRYFESQFVKDIQNIIDDLGKEEITARIIFLHQPLYSFKVPEALKEDMPYEEMEPYIEYGLWFNIDKMWTDADQYAEACMILEVISSIQASGYSPEQITFAYPDVGKEGNKYIRFHEWNIINNVSQIYELLD